jgi:hypothetical protein
MARVTELENDASKAAANVKRKAHAARRNEMQRAISAATKRQSIIEAKNAATNALNEEDRIRAIVDANINELQAQKAEIDRRIFGWRNNESLARARTVTKEAFKTSIALEEKATEEAEAQFPDMAGSAQFYFSNWQPPAEVLAAMEEARKDVMK